MTALPPRSTSGDTDTTQPLVAVYFSPHHRSPGLVEILVQQATRRGWRLRDLVLSAGAMPRGQTPVGALVSALPDDPICNNLRDMGCAIVRLGRLPHPQDDIMPAVLQDYESAGRAVAEHFGQRGYRDFAFVAHVHQRAMDHVYKGLQDRAAELGCHCHPHRFESKGPPPRNETERHERRAKELTDWLSSLPTPLALFAGTDFMAAQICLLAEDLGLSVPEDIAVMAWGNADSRYEMTPVPITSIGTDGPALVSAAAQLLDDLIHGKTVPSRTFVKPLDIVARRSTDMLAVDDPLVARAIRFIWDHLDRDLSVDDVAEQMQLPRYRLERAFRMHLKRGIAAELRRIRLERFCQLLRTTDLPVATLAPRVGFNSSQYLHNVFRKAIGMSPRQYRAQHREADRANDALPAE
jgi:LacI family transcriptional regulator